MNFLPLLLTLIFSLFLSPKSVQADSIKVVTYNVWYGFTKKKERKPAYLEYVRSLKADIVALQELNGYTEESLAEDAKFWGHSYSAILKTDGFPTGITSRYPLQKIQKDIEGYHHGMLSCKTGGIWVYVIHLHPGHWEIRHREVDLLLKTLASHKAKDQVLLVGDFNTFSEKDHKYYSQSPDMIPFFRRLDKRWKSNRNLREDKLDYSHLTKFEKLGYLDLVAQRRKEFLGTFPTKLRLDEDNGPSRRLDYFFANQALAPKCIDARYLVNKATDMLSDHYPAIAEFSVEKP